MWQRASYRVLGNLVLLVASGCITSKGDVGSTHVAVVAATPWEQYQHELQPSYKIDEAQALADAVPVTSRLDDSIFNAVLFRLTGGFTDAGILPASTTQPAAVIVPGPTSRPAGLDSALSGKSDGLLAVDPFLKYQLATALLQEVKLINRYVSDATVRDNYRPYIVRLQLTNIQRDRSIAADYYYSIAFFNKLREPTAELEYKFKTVKKAREDLQDGSATPASILRAVQNERKAPTKPSNPGELEAIEAAAEELIGDKYSDPVVIPLLVTDQAEAAIRSQRVETLRQLALAATVIFSNVQGTANLDTVFRQIEDALGRDYNSLLTVGRQSENVLRVRIGARRLFGDRYASITQNHFVTAVVLVPRTCKTLEIVSAGDIVDSRKGTTFRTRHPLSLTNRVHEAIVREISPNDLVQAWSFPTSKEQIARESQLADQAARGEFVEFVRALKELYPLENDANQILVAAGRDGGLEPSLNDSPTINYATAQRLYIALGYARLGDRYVYAKVELNAPIGTTKALLPEKQTIVAIDDGQKVDAAIDCLPLMANRLIYAKLEIDSTKDSEVAISASKVEVLPRVGKVALTFPSVAALVPDAAKDLKIQVSILDENGTITPLDKNTINVKYLKAATKSETKPGAVVVMESSTIDLPDAAVPPPAFIQAVLRVQFDKVAAGKSFTLRCDGATLLGVDNVADSQPLPPSPDATGFTVVAGAVVNQGGKEFVPARRLSLRLLPTSLVPNRSFRLAVVDQEGKLPAADPVSVDILP